MKLRLWITGSAGHKAEVLPNEIWQGIRKPYSLGEDQGLLTNLFGAGVTADLYENAICSLQAEGRHVDFRVLTEYVDQYEASAQTMRDRIRPACESVAWALQSSAVSAHQVRDVLRRFEYSLARRA